MRQKLWPYFVDGAKSAQAAFETGIHINTVRRDFRIWDKKIFQNEEKEFFRACKIAKISALLEIDVRLEKLKKYSDKLEEKLEQSDWSTSLKYAWVHERYERVQTKIAKLELERYNLESLPTADIRFKIDIANIMEEQKKFWSTES
jgi:hypothetical protein